MGVHYRAVAVQVGLRRAWVCVAYKKVHRCRVLFRCEFFWQGILRVPEVHAQRNTVPWTDLWHHGRDQRRTVSSETKADCWAYCQLATPSFV